MDKLRFIWLTFQDGPFDSRTLKVNGKLQFNNPRLPSFREWWKLGCPQVFSRREHYVWVLFCGHFQRFFLLNRLLCFRVNIKWSYWPTHLDYYITEDYWVYVILDLWLFPCFFIATDVNWSKSLLPTSLEGQWFRELTMSRKWEFSYLYWYLFCRRPFAFLQLPEADMNILLL